MCAFYGVSRNGYYVWKKREALPSDDLEIVKMIEECHKQHKRRYGYRRVTLWLKSEKQMTINHKKVFRITGKYNLLSAIRRRRLHKYKPNGDLKYANILNRDFHAERPNEKWVTDISYIITPTGTLYLSAIRDLFDNFIVAYKTSKWQDYTLVDRTIKAALVAEDPTRQIILHSDQGGQYRSFDYNNCTKENNLTPSMSAPHTPGDNACAENFFSIFKTECIYMEKPQNTEEADEMTAEFLDYYNYERIQLRSGLSPYEERRRWFDKHPES